MIVIAGMVITIGLGLWAAEPLCNWMIGRGR